MDQWLQILGALTILSAFVAVQFRVLEQDSYRYLDSPEKWLLRLMAPPVPRSVGEPA